jgi:hypothetical protein
MTMSMSAMTMSAMTVASNGHRWHYDHRRSHREHQRSSDSGYQGELSQHLNPFNRLSRRRFHWRPWASALLRLKQQLRT